MSRTEPTRATQPIILFTRPAAGGIRSHVIQLLRHLDRSRHTVLLAAPEEFLASLKPEKLPAYSGVPLEIEAGPARSDPYIASRLAAIAGEQSNAMVHAHGLRAGFVAALAKLQGAKFPLIVTYHNVPPAALVSNLALKFIASKSTARLAVSQAIANRLPGSPAPQVIPNGIDLGYFAQTPPRITKSKLSKASLKSAEITVGAIARLSPEKGIDLLLKAARATPDIRYQIAGTGSEASQLKANAPANVTFLGYVADTRAFYAACDVIVIPSRTEGQGIVALEAMASGVPVIASRVGGLAETIQSGATGILVEPENPSAISEAVLRLWADSAFRTILRDAGKEWVKQNADVKSKVAEVEGVYADVANSRK